MLDGAAISARITAVYHDRDGCYGAKRIAPELNNLGDGTSVDSPVQPVNHKRVNRLMKESGLAGFSPAGGAGEDYLADPSRRVFADRMRTSLVVANSTNFAGPHRKEKYLLYLNGLVLTQLTVS